MTWTQRSKSTSRTQPTDEPVGISEVKRDQRIDFDNDDDIIKDYITVARQFIEEQLLWKALLTQTAVDKFDRFGGQFGLAWEPVQSITSITYVDPDGDTQTLATSVYELATINGEGIVRLKVDQIWPTTQLHEDSVTVTYVAGFGDDADDVPISVRHAIRIYAGALYTQPDGDMGVPMQVDILLSGQSAMRILA